MLSLMGPTLGKEGPVNRRNSCMVLGVLILVLLGGCEDREAKIRAGQKAMEPTLKKFEKLNEAVEKHRKSYRESHRLKRAGGDRRSMEDESCAKTADCFEPLVCKGNACAWK